MKSATVGTRDILIGSVAASSARHHVDRPRRALLRRAGAVAQPPFSLALSSWRPSPPCRCRMALTPQPEFEGRPFGARLIEDGNPWHSRLPRSEAGVRVHPDERPARRGAAFIVISVDRPKMAFSSCSLTHPPLWKRMTAFAAARWRAEPANLYQCTWTSRTARESGLKRRQPA